MRFDNSFGIGSRVGKLVIKKISYKKKTDWGSRIYYECFCDCGKKRVFLRNSLKSGKTKSCGCIYSTGNQIHGDCRKGKRERLYSIWASMKSRCHDKTNMIYGGRGISVCEEWGKSYVCFRDWAKKSGYDSDLAIDRIDTDGNYSPDNCRWITQAENNRNARSNIWITKFGEKKLFWDWIKDPRCTVKFNTVYQRMRKGFSREESLFSPVDRKRFR